jgi:RNA polymerase sigma-70 factor, ECF subfamily
MNVTKQSIPSDEERLTKQAMNGDLGAFNQLVLRYQNMAYSRAYVLLGNPDEAEDATQESFIKAFQAMNGFRGGSFRGWLLKIVTNSAYDWMRRSRRHPTQPLFPEDENGDQLDSPHWIVDPAPSTQTAVEQNELSNDICGILKKLPEPYRSVLTLIDLYELDYTEAAQVLNIPLGTVKSRLARARLQMQKRLKERVDQHDHVASTTAGLAA